MPGPRKQPRRMRRKAVRGSKAFGRGAVSAGAVGFTRKKLAPFASAALRAAKGRSNNQHL